MKWYYAANGQQLGPFDDAAFQELAARGSVQPTTLVWHSGMSGWKPYAEAGAQTAPPAAAGVVFCSECGARHSSGEMIQFGDTLVCANCKDTFAQKLREGVQPGVYRNYGGFWIRFAARLIDAVLLWIVFYGITAAFIGSMGYRSAVMGIFSGIFLLQWAGSAAYEIVLVSRYGATLGKRLLGLRVITAGGGPISTSLSAGRYFAQLVSSATLSIGYLMAAFDDQKRTLHDRICNTRVVKI
jgi:uncharacterized RDD family membrane protein YckC